MIDAAVGICGSYGGFNLGDEAILAVMLAELRRSATVEVTVFSRDPADTLRRHDVEHAYPLQGVGRRDLQRIIADLDLLILGGGGILYDGDADIFLRHVLLAHEVDTPVMVYAISAGPLVDAVGRGRVKSALDRAAVITVRDRQTLQLLEEIGVEKEILLTADPAVLLTADALTLEEILRAEAIDPDARLIGFSVREPGPAAPHLDAEHYHRLLADAADFFVDRLDAEIIFFPLERRAYDVQHSHGVVGKMSHAQRATVLKRDYSPNQVVSLLERLDFAVGMRLHFLIFSALAGIPFIGLPYASKVTSFLEELQLPHVDLGDVSSGALIAHLDRAWDEREDLRARIARGMRTLQQRARLNNELALSLLSAKRARAAASPPP